MYSLQRTVKNKVVNVLQNARIQFDLESLTVNMPGADYLQTGDNSQLIINNNDVDFDKFKEEVLDKMDSGHKEILDVLINFKDQYDRNTKGEKGFSDEVSKALRYIINEVENIVLWQNRLVNQGVSISSKIKVSYKLYAVIVNTIAASQNKEETIFDHCY